MREFPRVVLIALATVLSLWLVLGYWPLSGGSRFALCLCISLICGAVLWKQWRRFQRGCAVSVKLEGSNLPPETFQGAVVLVCGDTASLFAQGTMHRETRQGWYLRAENAEQLPLLAQHLASVRPALVPQVSVLLAVMPEQHDSDELLAQSLRAWRRSITQCRAWLNGQPPLWSGIWVSPPDRERQEETRWFTVTPDLPGIQVRQSSHVPLPVDDWQREAAGNASRLYHALWLESVLALIERYVLRPLSTRQGELPALKFCASGICLTPVTAVADNLWQQQIAETTTLFPAGTAAQEMPSLPDVLLPYLPRRQGVSRRMQDTRLAAGICFLFLALAMLASFINNQRLVRSIGDHLAVYHRLSGTPPTPKQQAQQRLRADSRLLDDWQRRGEPLRYGLGLYQGMHLIPPVEAAINDWTPPPPPRPVVKKIVQGPQTIRLDSMSLFDTGKWALKPTSTKLLVNSLVGIKAKPGWLIVVAGHTDSTGDDKSNQVLSLKRAESVRDWMRDTGDVPESCFAVQGYGESRPVATNDTAEGRALNRRVEISLVPQANACQLPGNTPAPSQDDGASKNEME
ncbi:OmpA family protein [Lelliottia nimipressuralis]|uniref:OmpA family protein n=1 Tax=Lelliottia nimipressuralis TaxID=69220 RepID=UPI00106CA280|nr:OmpA family protein [Lelliottia nimipressuralis]TFB27355.1 OmpA family protein [Lelliottia nimipressuralis]